MNNTSKISVLITVLILIATFSTAQAQLFILEDYPGGYTKAVYQVIGENGKEQAKITTEVSPTEDTEFDLSMTFEGRETKEDLQLSLFGFFFTGMSYQLGGSSLDISPLHLIDTREVEPNRSYHLTPGMLETKVEVEKAGITGIMAIYTHPEYPNQKAKLIIPSIQDRKLLPFVPLFSLEEKKDNGWQIKTKVELIEFEHPENT